MKIAILGAGSLGTIVGALITKANYNVDLIDVNKANVDALNQKGAEIIGSLNTNISVSAKHPKDLNDIYDIVFLLTKQVYTKTSLTSILPFLHTKSTVCTLQNGIPQELVSSIVGRERTVSGAVGFGATWEREGVSRLTTEFETVRKYAFDVGELDGKITNRINTIKQVLDSVGHCEITKNIGGVKWTKLLMNTTFSGMSASLNCTFGDVLNNTYAMKSVANIADETIKVAHSYNIKLAKMQGKNFEFLELKNQKDISNKLDFYHEVWRPHSKLKASMLQDLEKKKPTEIDFINGYVVKKGMQSNVHTPFNKLICQIVQDSEKKQKSPSFNENIKKFKDFIDKEGYKQTVQF